MQIRYRITVTYAITVGVLLLLLCCSIYFLSAQNRTLQFKERLKARAVTTYRLFQTEKIDKSLVRKLTQYSSAALFQKSVNIYDKDLNPLFRDSDEDAAPLLVPQKILRQAARGRDVHFRDSQRDALAVKIGDYVVAIAAFDDDRVEWLSKLRLILAMSFVVSIGLVVLIGYIFSLGLVSSISRITTEVNHISSSDLSLRLDSGRGQDELERLALTINRLLERLQHSFETQSRFIDNASHELSTPLAVILSQLDIAKQRERSKEEYEHLVDSVYEDVSRLDVLVKSLLDLAKISGSPKGLELAPVRIDDLLMRLPVNIRKINPAYKVNMIFEEFPENEADMNVYGNEVLLFCAFQNVVHNACKYSPDHAARVRLEFLNETIRVSVEDDGPGIAPGDVGHIFQPFFRSLNVNTSISGTGLGLSLANNIIKLHNGVISCETEQEEGTTFIIEFPMKNKPL